MAGKICGLAGQTRFKLNPDRIRARVLFIRKVTHTVGWLPCLPSFCWVFHRWICRMVTASDNCRRLSLKALDWMTRLLPRHLQVFSGIRLETAMSGHSFPSITKDHEVSKFDTLAASTVDLHSKSLSGSSLSVDPDGYHFPYLAFFLIGTTLAFPFPFRQYCIH